MAVAFDAVSESHTGTTASVSEAQFSWTHTPSGTPAGVLVFTFVNSLFNDNATAVYYGSTAIPAVSGGRTANTSGEAGDCKAWFLGFNIPPGPQTVTVLRVNNAYQIYAVAITVTANTPTIVTGVQTDNTLAVQAEKSVDDGSVTGTDSVRFGAINSGLDAIVDDTTPAANQLSHGENSTELASIDIGLKVNAVVRENTAGQGARSVGFVSITSEDTSAVYLAVREALGANHRITQDVRLVPTLGDAQIRATQIVRVAAVNRTPANLRITQAVRLAILADWQEEEAVQFPALTVAI